ncbi:calcium/sodium antiporter [Algimonas porphyrae]|uniref:Sodium:calcium antiporter n=1 Tax=Algimonas porphyrae TaxID=1128113 RepID=A0ABQ5V0E6_9PROT|nr:calcium/sodium antiporter [Algimonas porphyrae]GLQ20144.1 sodium:calcium antiporter [Algimonas porphyrae]
MALLLPILLLILGLVILVVAGDVLVRGAAALARHWGVPALIVGLTIVAFGTSAPELVVSVNAVLDGVGQMAAGNVVGSNIANILLALGLPALIMAIPTNMSGVARNTTVCVVATLIFVILAFIGNPLIFWQGAILFAGIVIYLSWMFVLARAGVDETILEEMAEIEEGRGGLPKSVWLDCVYVVAGLIGLFLGGEMIVNNAVILAGGLGISETIIGLTIVAIGTSLPEITTVIVASLRGHSEVALGNVLGSNVFNLFAVMGAAAMTGPVLVEPGLFAFDFWVMLAATFALLIFVMSRRPIGRKTGLIFVVAYILYMLAILRGVM